MKFRSKTGEVFSGSILRRYKPFCHATICSKCPLQGPVTNCADTSDCSIWVVEHPHEAAHLMGFEVVEDEKEEANMDKPRICEVLGVEVGEHFKVNGYKGEYHVNEDGVLKWGGQTSDDAIYECINHPDRIIRKPRFTQQEVESAKIISVLFPEATHIERLRGSKVLGITGAEDVWIADIESSLFPEIKSGQSVTLDEIIGGAE